MKTLYIPLFLVSLTLPTVAQQQQITELQDTTLSLLRINNPNLLYEKPVFILPLSFALITAGDEPLLSLYQTFAGIPQSFLWNRQEKIDLTAPLKLQLFQGKTEKAFRITLGAAGTAGAFYFAYKHIKKYGLK